jgi:DNA-binding transcriptional LysR family regulator
VEKASRVRVAEDLWKQDKIDETLICLPSNETMCRHFQEELGRRGVDWFPGIEVSSVELIEPYVANGYGIGLSVGVPRGKLSPKVRIVSLPDFSPLTLGALWQGKLSPLMQAFLNELQVRAKQLASAPA